ncbi:MAG: hypothetical protein ACOX28_02680 [Bacilli bacterium]|jgi:hypothetical protein
MKEQLKKKQTWIAIIIMSLIALLISFGLYFITAYTNWFGGFVVSFPFGVNIVLLIFTLVYFGYGFIVTDFREARIRFKDKNWNGEMEEKEVLRKHKLRTAPWITALFLFIVVIIIEIVGLFL